MIVDTDYQRSGAGDLIQYIKRNNDKRVPVKDARGRELDDEDLEKFIEKSQVHEMERHFVLSPDPQADYTPQELGQNTRLTLNDWCSNHVTTEFVYAVHNEHKNPHVHVAATGRESELRMDNDDLDRLKENARETFREKERLPEREAQAEQERAAEQGPSFRNRDRDPAAEVAPDSERDPEPEREPEPEAERTRDWGGR